MKKLLFLLSTLMIGVMFQSCDKEDAKPEVEPEAPENGIEYVDLGLPSGTRWATCNIGASSPTAAGTYYAWYDIPSRDISTPTIEEWHELIDSTNWQQITISGVSGIEFRSKKNDNSIFIPSVGYFDKDGNQCGNDDDDWGMFWYWTSDLNDAYEDMAHRISKATYWNFYFCECSNKLTVRQVQRQEQRMALTRGTDKRYGNIDVNWIQLWENGPKFAEYNVGAASASEYGGYYTWGSSYQNGNGITFHSDYYSGSDDLKGNNDTATKIWGSNWRMPTRDEFQALIDNCDVEWTTFESMKGYKFTGKGAYAVNSVFFPAAGIYQDGNSGFGTTGEYWTSTSETDSNAYSLYFIRSDASLKFQYRGYARSVRAVLAK